MLNKFKYGSFYKLEGLYDSMPPFIVKNRDTDIYVTYNSTDRLDLISYKIYGFPEYYWIILGANNFSLELEIPFGTVIRIPYPLEPVLEEIKLQTGSLNEY